jgi:para-nitrobenzyl esterase
MSVTARLAIVLCACTATPPGVVQTSEGPVRGHIDADLVAFKGIPYAKPPTGDLRFRPPQPPSSHDGTLDARDYGSVCLQPNSPNLPTYRPDDPSAVAGDEDCLTLNIWTTKTGADHKKPVLFYIHGGAYVIGSSADQRAGEYAFDGSYLARNGAVVVTINYRLGALGFLAHPALTAESSYGGSGNYGFMDQIQALHWVHDNIAAFGGDPDRVMVFGVSAGGSGAAVMLASPLASGLVSSAIMESSSGLTTPLATAEMQGQALAAALGCDHASDPAACLRAPSGSAIIEALNSTLEQGMSQIAYGPVLDHHVLPAPLFDIFGRGANNPVPAIVGTAANEYSWILPYVYATPVTSDAVYRQRVTATFGTALGPKILSMYPSSAYPSPQDALVAIFTDYTYTCPARRIARGLAASQPASAWRYLYAHTFSAGPLAPYAAGHGFDDMMVWHNFPPSIFQLDSDEQALSDAMAAAWIGFAQNASADATWQPYDAANDRYQVFDTPIHPGSKYQSAECDFWDPYQY